MSDNNTHDHDDWFADLDDLSDPYADEGAADEPESSDTNSDSDTGDTGYVDEDGNPIPEDELHLYMDVDDDEADTPPTPAGTAAAPRDTAGPRVPKALIAGVLAGVVLIGGGAVWALSSLGEQNTAEDVATAVQTKTDAGKKKTEAKVQEVTHPPVDACDPGQLEGDTMWAEAGSEAPKMQLELLEAAPLPRAAAERVEAGGRTLEMEMLQVSRYEWGIYFVEPVTERDAPERWWKVDLDTSGGEMKMHELDWPGGDRAAMATCPLIERGAYQVVGENIPPEALGVRDGHVEVAMMMADASAEDADIVYGLVGESVAKMRLEYAPADEEIDEEEADQTG